MADLNQICLSTKLAARPRWKLWECHPSFLPSPPWPLDILSWVFFLHWNVTIKQFFIKSNPWAGGPCGREKCLPCLYSDEPVNCFAKGVVYDIISKECKELADNGEDIPVHKYTGTTARSLHQRGKEHLNGFLREGFKKKIKSIMENSI